MTKQTLSYIKEAKAIKWLLQVRLSDSNSRKLNKHLGILPAFVSVWDQPHLKLRMHSTNLSSLDNLDRNLSIVSIGRWFADWFDVEIRGGAWSRHTEHALNVVRSGQHVAESRKPFKHNDDSTGLGSLQYSTFSKVSWARCELNRLL